MKHLRFLLCLALAVTLLTACAPKEDGSASSSGGGSSVSSSGSGSDPEPAPAPTSLTLAACLSDSFHPVLGTNRSNLTLAPLLYEPLFQLDETFQPVPVLCSQAASTDGLIWELTLREGITFSDGSPLTGSVAADALNTARQSARYAQRLRDVSSISGQGNVVTVTLVRANGNLPALLDIPIASGTGDRPVGTGPYVLSETDGALALAARSGWWQGKALPVQTIRLTAASRSEDLVSSFSAGDIGLVDVDLMGTNAPGYSGSYQTWDYATTELLYLGLNTQSGLCRAPEVRQAIARAKGEPIQRDKSECLVDLRVDAYIPESYIADGPGRIEAYKRIAAIQTPEDAADVLDELIDRYGDPPPSVSDLVNVSLVRVQATAVGVYEVTQKKDTLVLQVETLDVPMIRGLLVAFNGRVTAGAGSKPYLSVTLQPDEKPLDLLQSILKAMAEILGTK